MAALKYVREGLMKYRTAIVSVDTAFDVWHKIDLIWMKNDSPSPQARSRKLFPLLNAEWWLFYLEIFTKNSEDEQTSQHQHAHSTKNLSFVGPRETMWEVLDDWLVFLALRLRKRRTRSKWNKKLNNEREIETFSWIGRIMILLR